jgi:hypothetical protein
LQESGNLVSQAVSDLPECGRKSAWRPVLGFAPMTSGLSSALRREPKASAEPLPDLSIAPEQGEQSEQSEQTPADGRQLRRQEPPLEAPNGPVSAPLSSRERPRLNKQQ